ncbi:MAG: thioredoxin domain-containing protein [Spirochaetales bacterium]|nr:thioredoxin domain-containing protein [Spirochaetales bacterium]
MVKKEQKKKRISEILNLAFIVVVGILFAFILYQLIQINKDLVAVKRMLFETKIQSRQLQNKQRIEINEKDAIQIGSIEAPVTMMLFIDVECDYCKRFNKDVIKLLKSEYVDTGKVRLVFKHFPIIDKHDLALNAALALEYANEEGKFIELFSKLMDIEKSLTEETLVKIGEELGLEKGKMRETFTSKVLKAKIQKHIEEAKEIGVKGTPSYVINGMLYTGAGSYDSIKKIINQELSNYIK